MNLNNRIVEYLLAGVLFACLVLCICSCKTLPAPVPTNAHHDSHDSVRTEYVHDSIYIDRWHTEKQKGDTVYIHDSIDRWRNRFVYIHDSIDNSRIDTIYQTVQVEKNGSVFLRNSGIALWVLIALLVVAVIIGIVLKFAK